MHRSFPHTTVWDLTVVPFLVGVSCVAPRTIYIIVRVSATLKKKKKKLNNLRHVYTDTGLY